MVQVKYTQGFSFSWFIHNMNGGMICKLFRYTSVKWKKNDSTVRKEVLRWLNAQRATSSGPRVEAHLFQIFTICYMLKPLQQQKRSDRTNLDILVACRILTSLLPALKSRSKSSTTSGRSSFSPGSTKICSSFVPIMIN